MAAKGGARLDLQKIGRNVTGPALLQQLQRGVELRLRIIGQCYHDVSADIRKARLPRHAQRLPALCGGVRTPQPPQAVVEGGLYAQRQPVCAGAQKAFQQGGGEGLGIRFHRHLGVGQRTGCLHHAFQLSGREQTGSPAAKIERVGAGQLLAFQLPHNGPDVFVGHAAAVSGRVKVAIATFGEAIGDMDVDAKGHTLRPPVWV